MINNFSLRRSTGLLALTTIIAQIINGMMILARTHFYLPASVGYLANAVSVATILAPFCTLQLPLAVPQQRERRDVAEIVKSVLVTTSIVVLLLTLLFLLLGSDTRSLSVALARVWPSALAIVPFIVMLDLARLLAAREGAFREIGAQSVYLASARAFFQLIGGLVGGPTFFLVMGETAGRFISLLATRRTLEGLWNVATTKRFSVLKTIRIHWRFPLISLPSTLLDNLGGYLPSILIADMYGADAAGWFFLAQRVISIPLLLTIQSTVDVLQVRAAQISSASGSALLPFVVRAASVLFLFGAAVVATLFLFLTFGWSFLFNAQWGAARDMAFALLLPGLFQMVTGPLSRVLVVAGRLSWKILFDVSFLSAALTPLIFPLGRAASVHDAVWRIGTGYLLAYVLYFCLIVVAAAYPYVETRKK